jgi:hypothetical protein
MHLFFVSPIQVTIILDSAFFSGFMVCCTLLALFLNDLRQALALPDITQDEYFHAVIMALFCVFLLEFVLLVAVRKNYVWSFYFFMDVLSVLSLIPEIPLIYDRIVDLFPNSEVASATGQVCDFLFFDLSIYLSIFLSISHPMVMMNFVLQS